MPSQTRFLVSAAVLCLIAGVARADGPPVIGFWDRLPATAPGRIAGPAVAKPDFIFTNVRLSERTRFTAFRDEGSSLSVMCCLEVSDLQPFEVEAIIAKYHYESDEADHLRSIKGLPFVYAAHPTERSSWSTFMGVVLAGDKDPTDLSPYWAPVIGARVADGDIQGHAIKLAHGTVLLHGRYATGSDKDKETDVFVIDGKTWTVSSLVMPTE